MSPLLIGLGIFLAGAVLRSAAVVEDARSLTTRRDARRADRLRASYVVIRLGAALMALGLTWASFAALHAPGLAAAVLLTPLMLVVSDLLPRALTTPRRGRAWSTLLGRALSPFEWLIAGAAQPAWSHQGLTPLVRSDPADELSGERHMARRVYDFADSLVGDIMVPLINVSAVRDDTPVDEVVRIATREGFSRFPVYHERLPNVVGLIHVFELLVPDEARTASDLMHEPTFVPDMAPASKVLRRLQAEGVNLAVVVDEYGGAVGIVAIEDILEEVVGEIEDEYDVEEDPVRQVDSRSYLIDATAEVARLNERFAWDLPEGEYETIGGMLVAHLARIPEVGESIDLGGTILKVTRASSRCVDEVQVERRGART